MKRKHQNVEKLISRDDLRQVIIWKITPAKFQVRAHCSINHERILFSYLWVRDPGFNIAVIPCSVYGYWLMRLPLREIN